MNQWQSRQSQLRTIQHHLLINKIFWKTVLIFCSETVFSVAKQVIGNRKAEGVLGAGPEEEGLCLGTVLWVLGNRRVRMVLGSLLWLHCKERAAKKGDLLSYGTEKGCVVSVVWGERERKDPWREDKWEQGLPHAAAPSADKWPPLPCSKVIQAGLSSPASLSLPSHCLSITGTKRSVQRFALLLCIGNC